MGDMSNGGELGGWKGEEEKSGFLKVQISSMILGSLVH
jgi:hypothetical protein